MNSKVNWKTICEKTVSLSQKEELIERWRQPNATLSELDRQCVMHILWSITWTAAAKHYKNREGGTDKVPPKWWRWYYTPRPGRQRASVDTSMERVLFLADMLRKRTDKSVGWSITAFKRRIAGVERLIQIKESGVGTPASEQAVCVVRANSVQAAVRRIYRRRGYGGLIGDDVLVKEIQAGRKNYNLSEEKARQELQEFRQLQNASAPIRGGELADRVPYHDYDVEDDALRPIEGEPCKRKLKSYTYLVL